MPSARRIRISILFVLLTTFIILYISTASRTTRSSAFYTKTKVQLDKSHYEKDVTNAMTNSGHADATKKVQDRSPTGEDRINDAKAQQELGQGRPEDTLKERLRIAEVAAKKSADDKWMGVLEAAQMASRDSDGVSDKGGAQVRPGETQVSAEGETVDIAAKAGEASTKIINEVKRSVGEELNSEHKGNVPVAQKEAEESKVKVEAIISEMAPDKDKAEELRRQILLAREREKQSMKAEYQKQLRNRELERQRAAGNKLQAVDPEFLKRQKQQAKDAQGKLAGREKAAATSKAPPVPTTPAEVEFQKLLALSPVTIFSKSYCPYSLKAKRILTQAFDITPRPYVVELDKHEMGKDLQAILFSKTQRSTVPNVIIAGKSIGGGDDVEKLWEKGTLRQTIKNLAGRRIVGVVENEDVLKKGWNP